ncbi:MAG: PAS domain-containing protein [Desulfovibrionaceae bacterium]|nr:PAS domain-containing protein [Desulfovibrionaceae bacterium]
MPKASAFEDKTYRIGFIGNERSLLPIWEVFQNGENSTLLSEVGVVAAALPGGDQPGALNLPSLNVPVYASYGEMLENHPEINLLFESTGARELIYELRRELPPQITLVERTAASFFIRLLSSEKMWLACKIDLMNTQTLLKTIIDQLSEDIVFLDKDGFAVNMNKTACEHMRACKKDLIGKHYQEIFKGVENTRDTNGLTPVDRTITKGQSSEAVFSQVDEDGRMRYFRLYTYPIHSDGQQLSHVVAMRRDITQRTQMEHRLQQSEKLASIGELSTYIAHEIRNPLFAISGFANALLRSKDQDEASRKKLNIILEESKRLDGILKSILNFARPIQAAAGVVDLNEVVDSTMRVMGIGCDSQGIKVNLELAQDLAKAKADAELIKQCLINLVKNSMEAMTEGGVLSVRTRLTRDYVVLEVEDTGKGIPKDIRDKVFSPFFSTKGKGSGLGLAMIRKIIDDIGGDLDLSSVEGQGTRVALFLPPLLAMAPPAQAPEPTPPQPGPPPGQPGGAG